MSAADTSGPAFPFAFTDESRVSDGMTLRDYFAGLAMPAAYKDLWDDVREGRNRSVPEDWRMGVALEAYALADAMLEARK